LPEAPAEERCAAPPDAREPRAAQGRAGAPGAHQALGGVARVSAALEIAKAATAPLHRADAPALARRLAARFSNRWLPRVAWTIERTGRAGLAGIALLLAAALFLFSTYLKVAAEVEALRADVAAAQGRARGP